MTSTLLVCKGAERERCLNSGDCNFWLTCYDSQCLTSEGVAHREKQKQLEDRLEAERKEKELAQKKAAFEAQQAKIKALQDQLENANDPEEIERLRRELEAETAERNAGK